MSSGSAIQEGIYYSPGQQPRNSYCLIRLRVINQSDSEALKQALSSLWIMYQGLRKSLIAEINSIGKDPQSGIFSVLFGYGPRFFELGQVGKPKPGYLTDRWLFSEPTSEGSPILPGVGLKYSPDIGTNEVANDHVIIQLIGNTEFAISRAVVETWKTLQNVSGDNKPSPMIMRGYHTGFSRPDGRGWLGFHDGVSNIKSSDRLRAIAINRLDIDPVDHWTAGGTYMAFLRVGINLNIWERIPAKQQERIIGREKSSGCLLTEIAKNDTNIFSRGCPAPGTSEIIQKGNEEFLENPEYSGNNSQSTDQVSKSHVGRMIAADNRIFRQGFEFLEPTQDYPFFRTGLNFVSFQKGTNVINGSIKKGFESTNFGGDTASSSRTEDILSVYAAGLFIVPPFDNSQGFPGEVILNPA